jgi:hypothetical protein
VHASVLLMVLLSNNQGKIYLAMTEERIRRSFVKSV